MPPLQSPLSESNLYLESVDLIGGSNLLSQLLHPLPRHRTEMPFLISPENSARITSVLPTQNTSPHNSANLLISPHVRSANRPVEVAQIVNKDRRVSCWPPPSDYIHNSRMDLGNVPNLGDSPMEMAG